MADYNSPMYVLENSRGGPIGGGHGLQGILRVKTATIAVDTQFETTDTLNFFQMPAGSRIHEAILYSDDLDNGSGITLDVGDEADPDRLFNGSTVGQQGGSDRDIARSTALNHVYEEDTLITGTAATNATIRRAGNITLTIHYEQVDFATS